MQPIGDRHCSVLECRIGRGAQWQANTAADLDRLLTFLRKLPGRCRVALERTGHSVDGVLAQSAEQRWQKLRGAEMLGKVITGVQFRNGVEVQKKDRQKIAA